MSENNWDGEGVPEVGQMVRACWNDTYSNMRLMAVKGREVCLDTFSEDGLVVRRLQDIEAVIDPKQFDAATVELSKLFGSCSTNVEMAESMVSNNWRKVKPLPADWYEQCMGLNMSVNDYLIAYGYCIEETTKNLPPTPDKHTFVNAGNMMVDKHGTSYLMYEGEVKVYKTDKNGNCIREDKL